MQITVHVTGLDTAIEHNAALQASLLDFKDAMVGVGEALTKYYSDAPFVTNGEVFGTRWKALKATTVAGKTRHAGSLMAGVSGASPLVRSGALKAGFRYEAASMHVFIDNKVEYWKYHQTGTGAKGDGTVPGVGRGKNLPMRRTIGVNEEVKGIIQAIIGAQVDEKIKAAMSS